MWMDAKATIFIASPGSAQLIWILAERVDPLRQAWAGSPSNSNFVFPFTSMKKIFVLFYLFAVGGVWKSGGTELQVPPWWYMVLTHDVFSFWKNIGNCEGEFTDVHKNQQILGQQRNCPCSIHLKKPNTKPPNLNPLFLSLNCMPFFFSVSELDQWSPKWGVCTPGDAQDDPLGCGKKIVELQ